MSSASRQARSSTVLSISGPLTGGLRVTTLVVLLAGILALALVGVQTLAMTEGSRAERERTADNLIWNLSQVVVETQNAHNQFLRVLAHEMQPRPESIVGLKSAAEIALGRISVAIITYRNYGQEDSELPGLLQLQEKLEQIVQELERNSKLSRLELSLMTAQINEIVRLSLTVSTGMLHDVMTTSQAERLARIETFRHAMWAYWALVVLLLAALWQTQRATRLYVDEARKTNLAARRLQNAFYASPDAVCVLDRNLKVVSHNHRFQRYAADEDGHGIRTIGLCELLDEKDRQRVATHLDRLSPQTFEGGHSAQPELRVRARIQAASGEPIPVEIVMARMSSETGDEEYVAFIHDRTADVIAEQDLRAARDQAIQDAGIKERFLHLIGHELRTPLQGIFAAVELLDESAWPKDTRHLRQAARTCAHSALSQIDSLLSMTRNGRLNDEPNEFSPTDLVNRIVADHAALAVENGNRVEIVVNGSDKACRIIGSEISLDLALRNLLSNANKYTRNGRIFVELTVKVDDLFADIDVSVTDTGIGIPNADLPRLFEEFARGKPGNMGAPTGFGLGLAIAQASVDRLGGLIRAQSELGRGSRFEISFRAALAPRHDNSASEGPVKTEGDVHRSHKILLVEDDLVNRSLLAAMINRLGHEVVTARDGEQALEVALQRRFDLVLMDHGLPGIDGLKTAHRMRAGGANQTTPIMLLTARDPAELEADLALVNGGGVLRKPIDMDRLSAAILHAAVASALEEPEDPLASAIDLIGMDATRELAAAVISDSNAALSAINHEDSRPADLSLAIRLSHRAAGSAGVLGAPELSQAWLKIERRLREGDEVTIGMLNDIRSALRAIKSELHDAMLIS